jgi:metal-responsive CopG/Arc/MetJ family transcriptional regulator
MNTVRLNITLPKEIERELDALVGPRRKSSFIADALKERIEKIKKKKLEKILEEGYKSTEKESRAIAKEFELSDLEGWDEY